VDLGLTSLADHKSYLIAVTFKCYCFLDALGIFLARNVDLPFWHLAAINNEQDVRQVINLDTNFFLWLLFGFLLHRWILLLGCLTAQKFKQLLDQLVRSLRNLDRRNETESREDSANLAEVKSLGGIVSFKILLLLFHAIKHAVELLEELLVSQTL